MAKRTCIKCGKTYSFLTGILAMNAGHCSACDKAHQEEIAEQQAVQAKEKKAKQEEEKFKAVEELPRQSLSGIEFDFLAAMHWQSASTITIDILDNPLSLAGLSGGLARFQVGIIAITKDEVIQLHYGRFEGYNETVAKVVPDVILGIVEKSGNRPVITRLSRTTARISVDPYGGLPLYHIKITPEAGSPLGGFIGKYYIDKAGLVCPRWHGQLDESGGKKHCSVCGWPDK